MLTQWHFWVTNLIKNVKYITKRPFDKLRETLRQAQGDNRCQAEPVEATSQLKLPKTLRQTVAL
ncbi:hypothetical protein EGI31_22815 [Lacihabitans soyangensis]|uniref:Uncharacterized protein n=1 Tax=Lacihabitans soyangensis TaxID=869394 RepID=A0AAE3H7C1_9BACT|nr:hypothetical protein [Lacihabitans soyangensis]